MVSFIGGGNQRKPRPVASHCQTLSHNVSSTPCHEWGLNTTLVVIGTECTGSCKSNYHTITTTTAPAVNGINHYCDNISMQIQTCTVLVDAGRILSYGAVVVCPVDILVSMQ